MIFFGIGNIKEKTDAKAKVLLLPVRE